MSGLWLRQGLGPRRMEIGIIIAGGFGGATGARARQRRNVRAGPIWLMLGGGARADGDAETWARADGQGKLNLGPGLGQIPAVAAADSEAAVGAGTRVEAEVEAG